MGGESCSEAGRPFATAESTSNSRPRHLYMRTPRVSSFIFRPASASTRARSASTAAIREAVVAFSNRSESTW